ncbi:MAG: DMT family transporter [Akkermansia sp.]
MTITPFRALISVLLANVLFGLMSPVAKLSMAEGVMDGVSLASLRLGGAALLFWLLSFFVPHQKVDAKDWFRLFLMSLCGMALNQYLFIVGVSITVPSHAALAATITPALTVLLGWLIYKQRISWLRLGGLVLAAVGVLIMVLSANSGGKSGHPLGDVMCLCSQMLSSCYFLFFMPLIKKYHPVVLMKWLFSISAVISMPFVAPHLWNFPWAELSTVSCMGALYVVVGATFLSYLLILPGQKYLPTSVVVAFIYLQAVIAAAVSIAWGLEGFTFIKLIASLMIGTGVWIVQYFAHRDHSHAGN